MQHTIQSSNQYLTNDQIVVAGVLALSPLGIIGIPDLLVHRKKQALWHLILFLSAIVLCALVSMSALFFVTSNSDMAETMPIIGGYLAGAIIIPSYIWSVWEGAWILGHIETVRAQANNRYPSNWRIVSPIIVSR